MQKIRFGIIGCGDVTEVKSGPALQKASGSELVMVMRRDREKLESYAKRHSVPRFTTDYLQLLGASDIDAVYIATPPHMHAFYTMEAARHGKAVYVEKPMARTAAECRSMVSACRKAGVPLFAAYYRRGQPKFLKARDLIRSGALGTIYSFHYLYACPPPEDDPKRPWLFTKEKAGGGLLYDIGSHMIDILLFLLGEPQQVLALSANQSKKQETDDMHSALVRFTSGVQGTVQLSFNSAETIDRLWISGSQGSMSFSIMSNDPIDLLTGEEKSSLSFQPLEHVQQPFIQQVVNTLLGKDTLDKSGQAGMLTQEIIEAIDLEKNWFLPDKK